MGEKSILCLFIDYVTEVPVIQLQKNVNNLQNNISF